MRRTVVFLTLLVLATPIAASAAMRAPGDGSLSVRDLDGVFYVSARGAIIGRCTECTLFVDERADIDTINPVVFGARGTDRDGDGDKDLYRGKDLRFKVIGGSFRVRITRSTDVDLSLVGKGTFRIQGTAGRYLINAGYAVRTASTGADALAHAANGESSLVILDLNLPDIDGIEVCRRIRKSSDVPILMLTARDEDVDKIIGLEVGADDYMTKPFNPRELVARVKSILRRAAP